MHLVVDGHGGDYERLQDLDEVYQLLDRLPDRIEMTKIMPPYVFRYRGVKPEDWGVSGFVLIAESHIAVHTWPEFGYAAVDIFCCNMQADLQDAVDALAHRLRPGRVQTQEVARGEMPVAVKP